MSVPRKIKLTKQEKEIENALLKGEFADASRTQFEEIARAVAARRKNAVLNIRVNKQDLETIKRKSIRLGVRYQTFLSELIHRVAHS